MFLGSGARPVRMADNLNAICELIVYTMWDPQHITTLLAFTACYGYSFTLYIYLYIKVTGEIKIRIFSNSHYHSNKLWIYNLLLERNLCSKSRTREQSFISVLIVYSVSTDNIFVWMYGVQFST
jgi:hypothetical protein